MNKGFNKQSGFVAHITLILLTILVIGGSVGAFLYVKDQSKENKARDEASKLEIAQLKQALQIPDGWELKEAGDFSVYLPSTFELYGEANEPNVFISSDEISVSAFATTSPRIYSDVGQEDYCTLDDGSWIPYTNKKGPYQVDTSAEGVSKCEDIQVSKLGSTKTYEYEVHDNALARYYLAFKAGNTNYVFSGRYLYSNYGEEAIVALIVDGQSQLRSFAEKFIETNHE